MKVIHISAECFPMAKVGGLADVVGALPKFQQQSGTQSMVVMPLYDNDYARKNTFKILQKGTVTMGKNTFPYAIKTPSSDVLGYELILVDIPALLFQPYVYSSDDAGRFIAFQKVVLDWILKSKTSPDIVHCHDHHTGLIPFFMSHVKEYQQLKNTPSVLTIHNAQYQGWIPYEMAEFLPSIEKEKAGLLDWNGTINSLAAAIKCAWHVTTVSQSYLEELKTSANGLESLIQAESNKCTGILNGIDIKVWSTETDEYLVKNYKVSSAQSGKKANKAFLCKEFDLDPKLPLVVFIGRLVYEKGADLFPAAFEQIMKKQKLSLLLLGSGAQDVENKLKELKYRYEGSYNTFIGYDEPLAHLMYAGADFLLMPSRIEPCGLNQMYALRYGTMPIVSSVGGLKDTVTDIDQGGYGIRIPEVSAAQMEVGVQRALLFYTDQKKFKKTRTLMMKVDHSWDMSAKRYLGVYKSLIA